MIADDEPGPPDDALERAYRQRLGERLREVRRAQGLRLQDVEARSGGRLKAVVVGSYERGDRAVAIHRLAALADVYEVPVEDLLPNDENWPSVTAQGPLGVRIALGPLHACDDPELHPLQQLARHVRVLRGDLHGPVLTLRGDDLRTVAFTLGLEADELAGWLEARGLLARP